MAIFNVHVHLNLKKRFSLKKQIPLSNYYTQSFCLIKFLHLNALFISEQLLYTLYLAYNNFIADVLDL